MVADKGRRKATVDDVQLALRNSDQGRWPKDDEDLLRFFNAMLEQLDDPKAAARRNH